MPQLFPFLGTVFLSLTLSLQAYALSEKAQKLSKQAANAIEEQMNNEDSLIPDELLSRAKCIAHVTIYQGGLGIGFKGGQGLVSCQDDRNQWSAPVYLNMGGMNYGSLIGFQKTELTLVFTNKNAVHSLVDGNLTLGGEAGLTLGPIGRNASIGTNINLDDAIFSYSYSKGLYAGIAFDGSYLQINHSLNREVYGHSSSQEIFNNTSTLPAEAIDFIETIRKYTR